MSGEVGYAAATVLGVTSDDAAAGYVAATVLGATATAAASGYIATTLLYKPPPLNSLVHVTSTVLRAVPQFTVTTFGSDCGPEGRLLLPDKYLRGRDNVQSVTGEGGATAGIVTTLSAYGAMVPRHVATPVFDPTDPDMRVAISQAGGLNTARWVWRDETESAFDYRGTSAVRFMHNPGAAGLANDRIAAVYSRKSGKLIVFSGANNVSRRDIRDDPFSGWVHGVWAPLDGDLTGETTAACEMDNGNILVLRATENGATTIALATQGLYNDLNLSVSQDGGVSFTRIHTNLLARLIANLTVDLGVDLVTRIRIASSGSHVRILFRNANGDLVGLVSHNYGASWIYSGPIHTVGPEVIFGAENHGAAFDLVGLGNGQFLMCVLSGTVSRIQSYAASGTEPFGFTSIANTVSTLDAFRKIASIALARVGTRLYLSICWGAVGYGGHEIKITTVGNHSQMSDWNSAYDAGGAEWVRGTDFGPFAHQLVPAGPYLYGIGRMADYGGGVAGLGFGCQWHHLGWTRRSVGNGDTGENGSCAEVNWQAFQGSPAGFPAGVWLQTAVGGSEVVTIDTLELTDRHYLHTFNVLSAASSDVVVGRINYRGGVGSTLSFLMSKTSGDGNGIRVRAQLTVATMVDFSVKVIGTTLVLNDLSGFGVLTTLAGFTTGVMHLVRVVASSDNAGGKYAQIMFKPINNGVTSREDVGWIVGARQSVGATPGTTNTLEWGVPAGGTGVSEWKTMKLLNADIRSGGLVTTGSTMLGMVTSEEAVYAADGREVAWGGDGGVVTDRYLLGTRYMQGIQNIFDPRPGTYWEDDSTVAEIILRSDASAIGVLDHDHIYLDGLVEPSAVVDYSDDVTFAVGVEGLQTISTVVYEVMTVAATYRNQVAFTNPDPTTPTPISGELNGFFIRILTGADAGTTYWIAKHENQLAIGLNVSAAALTAGDTFSIFGSKASAPLVALTSPKRYMRVRFADASPFGGAHRCSVFVAGPAIVFDPPMEWERTDLEAPNVTMAVTKSGSRFAYKEGENQRTFAGRVIGDNYSQLRFQLRYMLSHLAGYLLRPCVLITDADDTSNRRTIMSSIHGRMETPSDMQHSAFMQDANTGELIRTGDLSLVFSEEK